MENGKIVVLQVLGGFNLGGAESRIMDIARNLNGTDIVYKFLLHTEGGDYYEEEAESLGLEIYRVPRFKFYNLSAYKKALKTFFTEHKEIDIVQGHMTSTAAIYLPIAKRCNNGVVTIAHARSAGVDKGLKGILTLMLRKNLPNKTDYMWACSTEAAISVYGNENYSKGRTFIIPNAINVEQFIVDDDNEQVKQLRSRYGLEGSFVVGHVGSFRYAKNHEFLLQIFSEILRIRSDSKLLLVGDGKRREEIKTLADNLGISDKVIFAGNHSNVNEYYKLMDILIFPSRYEGLPGTIVESEAAGLPALISSAVTRDVGVTELVRYKSLEEGCGEWAKEALDYYEQQASTEQAKRQAEAIRILKDKGFDVKGQVQLLGAEYRRMVNKV